MNDPKKKSDIVVKTKLKNTLLEALYTIQNGSITVIKQDNTIIQINLNETIFLGDQSIKENVAKGA
ncbi:DUF2292 domain-containing protein [Bacillota bacterium LX-D]|nr:DUF2292 domain-containing protein [Bacillota bacterium LX-D]